MEIVSKRNRVCNKFYDEDYDLEFKANSRPKKSKTKKTQAKAPKNPVDVKKKVKYSDSVDHSNFQPPSKQHTHGQPESSVTPSDLGLNPEERPNTIITFPTNLSSMVNPNSKTFDQELMNNILNSSSINSESHKRYELDNIEFFQKLVEDKYDDYYGNDNRLIGQLGNSLLVNNMDHQFLFPWVDLISPNRSKPFCVNMKVKSQASVAKNKEEYKYSLKKHDNFNHRMLYLTETQMFHIIDSVLEQIINTPKNTPVMVDWLKVSRSANLSQDVCKDFWWSFDRTHIKDEAGGVLLSRDWNHYCKVDEWYFVELKDRVQNLVQLANECKAERERIFYHFMYNEA